MKPSHVKEAKTLKGKERIKIFFFLDSLGHSSQSVPKREVVK